ncbi:MAG: dihydrolipoyl dehydrogenase [Chlamydiia bacterium]
MRTFDVVVIGAGPGGYVAAIYAAHQGFKTALISKQKDLGGTCLNRGCIPSKALISSADVCRTITQEAEKHGIEVPGPVKIHYEKLSGRKDEVVRTMQSGLRVTILSHHVELIEGVASFESQTRIQVKTDVGSEMIDAKMFIIATGSEVAEFPSIPFDHNHILSSTSILDLKHLPASLAVIGGGYIGCELACMMRGLGVEVTIIEALDRIIKAVGVSPSDQLTESCKAMGIRLEIGKKVLSHEIKENLVELKLDSGEVIHAEKVLVAIGRKPFTDGLKLEKAGVYVNPRGFVQVDPSMRTNIPNIYAIGDVTGLFMLAHAASYQGKVAVDAMRGVKRQFDPNRVPQVIFTKPEIATVGRLEGAKEVFPYSANGKAVASGKTFGTISVYYDLQTKKIQGVEIIGEQATTMIAVATIYLTQELTLDTFDTTIFAHPTYAEALVEPFEMVVDKQIHFPAKKKARPHV